MQNELDTRRKEAEKVTLIGSAVDLFLGVTKIVVGFFANSAALVADGVHSLSDLATDFMVIRCYAYHIRSLTKTTLGDTVVLRRLVRLR